MIQAKTRFDYTAATFAAQRTMSLDVFDSQAATELQVNTFITPVSATLSANPLSYTAGTLTTNPVYLTVAVTNEIIQMRVKIDVVPGAGSVNIAESWILAVRVA